jgi:DNA-binding LacI/PurR family transcriptional regulator
MAVRLIDVARAAKVSRSTASNVFSNPDRVRQNLRERVHLAAKKLGYLGPDPKGRILRAGKLNSIGVVSPGQWGVADTLRNPVFAQFLMGVAQACDEAGASMVIVPDKPGHEGIRSALVDGFIFGRIELLNQLEPAQLRRLPFAVVDYNAGRSVNSVRVDARAGAKAAAQHLIDLGHRRFGILSFLRGMGPARVFPPGAGRPKSMAGMAIDQEKLQGYAEAFAAAGINIDDVPVVQAEPWDERAAGVMLDEARGATAILSMAVMQAIALIREAERRGINVPADLSIVGFNDIPEAAKCTPPLTTVDSCTMEKGRVAAEIVLVGTEAKRHVLQPKLLVRGSTARPSSQYR